MLRRLLMLLVIGGLVAVVATPATRSKLLDLLFGAEEEFEYTPLTDPVADPIAA